MWRSTLFLILLLFSVSKAQLEDDTSFNPCDVDQSACVPLMDFQANCTCVLFPGKVLNVSDDAFLFFSGFRIPFNLFAKRSFPRVFRDQLSKRIPSLQYFESALDLAPNLYRGMVIEEEMRLFVVNASLDVDVLKALIDSNTKDLREGLARWCSEGECDAFIDEADVFNATAGLYSTNVDLLIVVELGGRSLFALSTIHARFNVPKVHSDLCRNECRHQYWANGVYCRRQCEHKARIEMMDITGRVKKDFHNFVRASTIHNLRAKYIDFIQANRRDDEEEETK